MLSLAASFLAPSGHFLAILYNVSGGNAGQSHRKRRVYALKLVSRTVVSIFNANGNHPTSLPYPALENRGGAGQGLAPGQSSKGLESRLVARGEEPLDPSWAGLPLIIM